MYAYDPLKDSEQLKKNPGKFEELRSEYQLRREYKAFRILNTNETDAELLRAFGFQTPLRTTENSGGDSF